MQIAVHLGAHCTDEGRLVRSLLRSRGALREQGVIVSPPRHYRPLLRETMNILNGSVATGEVQELLIDTLVDEDDAHRVILFNEYLICIPQRALSPDGIYEMAGRRIAAFAKVFPDHECQFFMALCNPATMAVTLVKRAGPDGYDAVLAGVDIFQQRWLATVRDILATNPGINLTLWCNEDTPLIWPEILRAIGGSSANDPLEGDQDLLNALLSDQGIADLATALEGVAIDDVQKRHAIYSSALEKHALAEELDVEVDLPGWSAEHIERITNIYMAECQAISELPGVRFLAP